MTSRFRQSFAFHGSPEAFISSRLQQFSQQLDQQSQPIIRAEILNRNVHLITSYEACKAILLASEPSRFDANDAESVRIVLGDANTNDIDPSQLPPDAFAVGPAYEQLMVAFFPAPNILLADGTEHMQQKSVWESAFPDVVETSIPVIRHVTEQAFSHVEHGTTLDLYERLKRLSWDVMFAVFLGLDRHERNKDFDHMERLQEAVLRGQFSLFPVPIRTPFWTSARSRGLQAVNDLGPAIQNQLRSQWAPLGSNESRCPFAEHITPEEGVGPHLTEEDIISHTRLFTSSIANKALASLTMAFVMNLFLWRGGDVQESLASMIADQSDVPTRTAMLNSILKETMRLSPPVIGVMRRVTQTLHINEGPADSHAMPAGHDAWLYFSAANRDLKAFEEPNEFRWDRFIASEHESNEDFGFAFGLGPKRCLGAQLVQRTCLTVAETLIDSSITFEGSAIGEGVKAWLGWEPSAGPELVARDLKQLPCQRPRDPVVVTLSRGKS